MDKTVILAFAGSLRRGSYNRALLKAASELAPEDCRIEVFDLEGIPPFNQDLEAEPAARVRQFKAGIKAADAILIATPEYNYSVPGVLKNAIDWASRPRGDNSFDGKPAAIMGASNGIFGTARAQYHLRQTCVSLNMRLLNRPEVMVASASDKVTESGDVTDAKARELIGRLVAELAREAARQRRATSS